MRIALMTNNYKPFLGGVPISIERLARGLKALGHQVTIFAPTYNGCGGAAQGQGDMSEGADGNKGKWRGEKTEWSEQDLSARQEEEEGVFRYATLMNHFIGGIVLPNPFDRRIEKEFCKNPYDIIHVHHPVLIGRTAVYLSRKYNIPLVFTYHTRYEQYLNCYTKGFGRLDRFMPFYLNTFFKYCSFVFAPTEGMYKYLTDVCGVETQKTGILPTGIEEKNFCVSDSEAEGIREKYCAQGMPLMLTVSRMAKEKNVAFLIESLALARKSYGGPFRVLMVGDGPDRAALEKRAADLGMEDYIMFTGTVPNEEIAPYFRAADFFLFASKTETQGIVVLEAFAGETPVIAVRASGVADLVEDGKNGFLTLEEPQVYAAQLVSVLKGNYDTAQLKENAGRTCAEYRQETIAKRAVCYYNRVIASRYGQEENVWKGWHHQLADGRKRYIGL